MVLSGSASTISENKDFMNFMEDWWETLPVKASFEIGKMILPGNRNPQLIKLSLLENWRCWIAGWGARCQWNFCHLSHGSSPQSRYRLIELFPDKFSYLLAPDARQFANAAGNAGLWAAWDRREVGRIEALEAWFEGRNIKSIKG